MNSTGNISNSVNTAEVSPDVFYSIGIIFSILFILALLEDISVIVVYNSCKKLQIRTNMWIMAVIYCDLLILLNAFPIVIVSSFAKSYIFGDSGCKWDGFIVTTLGCTSIYLLACLSLHRYLIMQYGSSYKDVSWNKIIQAIGACFLGGLFWGFMPIFGWGSYTNEGIGVSCAPNWKSRRYSDLSYIAAMYMFVLFIPLIIIITSYASILLKIWRAKKMRSAWIQKRSVVRDVKVTMSVAFVILSFIISWTPYAVVSLLTAFFKMNLEEISPVIVQLPCLMAKTACIWNPVVYVCHNREFRKAFVKKFRLWNKASSSESTSYIKSGNNTFEQNSTALKEIGRSRKYIGDCASSSKFETICFDSANKSSLNSDKLKCIAIKGTLPSRTYLEESEDLNEFSAHSLESANNSKPNFFQVESIPVKTTLLSRKCIGKNVEFSEV